MVRSLITNNYVNFIGDSLPQGLLCVTHMLQSKILFSSSGLINPPPSKLLVLSDRVGKTNDLEKTVGLTRLNQPRSYGSELEVEVEKK